MENGMFIRTSCDGIQRIISVDSEKTYHRTCSAGFDYHSSIEEDKATKFGFNKTDVIECGDYVNGYKVECIGNCHEGVYIEIPFIDSQSIGCNADFIKEEDIKSIVTKEQFEEIKFIF